VQAHCIAESCKRNPYSGELDESSGYFSSFGQQTLGSWAAWGFLRFQILNPLILLGDLPGAGAHLKSQVLCIRRTMVKPRQAVLGSYSVRGIEEN
jgi:hypothetical protein